MLNEEFKNVSFYEKYKAEDQKEEIDESSDDSEEEERKTNDFKT